MVKKAIKKNKYEPVTVHVSDPDELFSAHQYDVSKSIILAISFAVKHKLKKVDFAKVIVGRQVEITMELNMDEYEDTLDKNIKIMEKFEEYEACEFAVKLKNKIKALESKSKRKISPKKESSWDIDNW